jgi:hypothetical protein
MKPLEGQGNRKNMHVIKFKATKTNLNRQNIPAIICKELQSFEE